MERKKNMKKEVNFDGSAYILYFTKNSDNFEMTLYKKIGKQQWTGYFDYIHLTSNNDKAIHSYL
jgi:hypothetical protein